MIPCEQATEAPPRHLPMTIEAFLLGHAGVAPATLDQLRAQLLEPVKP